MCNFVRDDVAPGFRRREDQAPTQSYSATRRTTAPTRPGVADTDRFRNDTGRCTIFGDFAGHGLKRHLLEENLHAPRHTLLRPAAQQFAISQHRRSPSLLRPGDSSVSPLNRNDRSRHERLAWKSAVDLRLDPFPLIQCPGESRPAARPQGTSQLERPATFVKSQPQTTRIPKGTDLDGNGKRGLQGRFRAGARPHDIRVPLHLLR